LPTPSITVTRPTRPVSEPSVCVSGRDSSSAGDWDRNWVTYTFVPSALMAIPRGLGPTGLIVLITASVEVLMSDTSSEDWLVT